MKTKILPNILITVGVLFALTGLVAADKPQPTIITFDAPGAVNGTEVAGINPAGVIAGSYVDANNALHGYLRAKDGTFTTYDVPGAGTGSGQGTFTTASTLRGRSRELWLTLATLVLVTCALRTALSSPLMRRMRDHSAPSVWASTRRG